MAVNPLNKIVPTLVADDGTAALYGSSLNLRGLFRQPADGPKLFPADHVRRGGSALKRRLSVIA